MVQTGLQNPDTVDIQVAEDILNLFEDFKEDETTEQQVNRFRDVLRTSVSPFSLIMHTAQEILNGAGDLQYQLISSPHHLCDRDDSFQIEDELVRG